ncbi:MULTISPECIES: Fic family protein [Serratia]|uniref:Fic family protein n=1 Tax=Serratia TaxID=613 RepID=UPI0013DCF87C|nr:Fic family protein [Serratia marcescens]MDX7486507.1 Fic family protein [Serratia marcescens]BEL70291.1 hypothetical protein SM10VA4_13150 [Serratia marcescens]
MENYVIQGKVIKLLRMDYPKVNHFHTDTRLLLDRTQVLIQNISFEYKQLLENANQVIEDKRIQPLQHRLSAYVDLDIFPSENSTSQNEAIFYHQFYPTLSDIVNNNLSFIQFIEKIGSEITRRSFPFRKANIRTVPDKDGSYTEFIDISLLSESLSNLREYAKGNSDDNKLFHAIIFAVMFMHIHPLQDGNGRAARILFNLMLQIKPLSYLPLTELCHFARSGYVLSLREAFLFSEWDNIIKFYCNCIHLLYDSATSELTSMQ